MKQRKPLYLLLAAALTLSACMRAPALPEAPSTRPETETPAPTPTPTPTPTPMPTPTPTPAPQRGSWTISFAGDCTIGTLHEWQGARGRHNMLSVMDGDWSYPFSGIADVFAADDFTMVNLEGTFTARDDPVPKRYRFRAPPEAARTLLCGSVEAVTLSNNHSGDYRAGGLQDTKEALDGLGVLWTDDSNPFFTRLPDDGPLLGVIAYNCVEGATAPGDVEGALERLGSTYDQCRGAGCDFVIAFLHWGWEYRSEPENWVVELAHRLSELGCDMILGSHPHVLQRAELYDGVPIVYSLGNFCFGGNSAPEDTDSVIVQQTLLRTEEGFALGETRYLPCCISSTDGCNDFRPVLYAEGDPAYARVLQKLAQD